jgi:hypothetical protein
MDVDGWILPADGSGFNGLRVMTFSTTHRSVPSSTEGSKEGSLDAALLKVTCPSVAKKLCLSE